MTRHQQLEQLLRQIEREMQALSLWQQTAPPADALASSEPFCIDRLAFSEWLQWIMIPRFDAMIAQQLPLPHSSDIAAMAEEAFKGLDCDTARLLALLHQVDSTLRLLH